MKINLVSLLFILASNVACAEALDKIDISEFTTQRLKGWKCKEFEGETRYTIVSLDGQKVLRAMSDNSASGLFKEQKIDLTQTPYLNWRWRIDNRLSQRDEQAKSGDDYAARIYVVIDGGWTFWNTKAINYVWSGSSPKGKIWPNAFAGKNAMMIAVRSRKDPTEEWLQEKRNVFEDLKKVYGKTFRTIDAVAIMSDTDNGGGKATAYYSDIYFSRN